MNRFLFIIILSTSLIMSLTVAITLSVITGRFIFDLNNHISKHHYDVLKITKPHLFSSIGDLNE